MDNTAHSAKPGTGQHLAKQNTNAQNTQQQPSSIHLGGVTPFDRLRAATVRGDQQVGQGGQGGVVPQSPVSVPQKEQLPAGPNAYPTEYITPSEAKAEKPLPKEVAEAGVEKVPEVAPLPQDADKVGVRLSGEATPVSTQPTGIVQLPKTEEEVKEGLKTQKNPNNSITWFLTLLQRVHRRLKGAE